MRIYKSIDGWCGGAIYCSSTESNEPRGGVRDRDEAPLFFLFPKHARSLVGCLSLRPPCKINFDLR